MSDSSLSLSGPVPPTAPKGIPDTESTKRSKPVSKLSS